MEATFEFGEEQPHQQHQQQPSDEQQQQQQDDRSDWTSTLNHSMDIPVEKLDWQSEDELQQHQLHQLRHASQQQQQQQQQQLQASEEAYRNWLLVTFKDKFEPFEAEGGMPQERFKELMEQHNGAGRRRKAGALFRRLDRDANKRVSWEEFYTGLTYTRKQEVARSRRLANQFVKKLAPAAKRKLRETKRSAADDGEPIPEETYLEAYSCKPPPLFIPALFIACWICFAIYAVQLHSSWNRPTWDSGMPFHSPLVFCPSLRQQAWRYISYSLLHNGYQHIVINTVLGCVLGIPLEAVHKAWRVAPVFLLGVLSGSLASSVADPSTALVGASGGVYALIGAHYALVLMNWEEVQKDWLKCHRNPLNFLLSGVMRLVYLTLFIGFDFGLAAYRRYATPALVQVSVSAHFGGMLAGLLIGTPVLRNIDKKPWEGRLAIVSIVVAVVLLALCIVWNFVYRGFPDPQALVCSNPSLLA